MAMLEQAPATSRQRLQDLMYQEVVAARSLFMDGFLMQTAGHLLSAWHALACLTAHDRGEPLPPLETFELDQAALPNRRLVEKHPDLWRQSFAALQRLPSTLPLPEWMERHAEQQRATRAQRQRLAESLRYQLQIAEDACQKIYWQDRRRWVKQVLGRRGVIAGTVILLVLALGSLGGLMVARKGWRLVIPWPSTTAKPPDKLQPRPAPPRPMVRRVKLADIARPIKTGTPFDAPGVSIFGEELEIDLGSQQRAREIEVSLDNNDAYALEFFKSGTLITSVEVPINLRVAGLRVEKVVVPEAVFSQGYDLLKVRFLRGDAIKALGHLLLLEPDADASVKSKDSGHGP